MSRIGRRFFSRAASEVAPDLLGMHLVVREAADGARPQRLVTRIVEVEAYEGPEDLAAHSAGGRRTARTEVMYGIPGHAYIYLVYGMHHCFNVVTAPRGLPHAVLVRAVEPISAVLGKTAGPGLLCKTLGIDRSHDGLDLTRGPISIERPAKRQYQAPQVESSPRIGIDYAGPWVDKPWRFFDAASRHVSRSKHGRAR